MMLQIILMTNLQAKVYALPTLCSLGRLQLARGDELSALMPCILDRVFVELKPITEEA
jgi:hypothetical protein